MIPFLFNENRFSFFVADHLLIDQLCTNPKSDRSLCCILICRCMQNHNDTIMTSDTVLKKYIPLTLLERVVCERELETEQNCNILTPTLLAITVFLSCSPGLLNRGPRGPAPLDAGFLYRILSLTRLIPNCSVRGLRAHSAGCWLSLLHLVTNWSGLQNN